MTRFQALRKAQSRHKRKHWQMAREDAASVGMSVNQTMDGWTVMGPKGMIAGPFESQSKAWRWIDRHTITRRYGY